ncbi:MAG: ABC transporter ATP-binding protein [Bacilli bacterium]|nr:ABC transporter ATP-binding protein [Bacilli bacterium]
MNIIEVEHLTKDYGYERGVFDISFSVKKGEVFGFLGPNGSGKSTTIRHIMGFSKPDSGEIKVFGKDTFQKYYEILNKIGYIPGEIALPVGLTGWEFIKMIQDLQHIHNNKMLEKMLSLFKLEDKVLKEETKRMSLGVKRKLAIVTAFMSDPEVLILDEPTSGLDPVMQEVFINFIKEEKARGKTILLSSHMFSEVDATCDTISIIKDGKIVSKFASDDLKHAKKKFYDLYFAKEEEYQDFCNDQRKDSFITIISRDDFKKNVFISTNDEEINKVIAFLSKFDIDEFSNKKETLEDYFMKFYKEDKNFGGAL